jgi:hypothetical protein
MAPTRLTISRNYEEVLGFIYHFRWRRFYALGAEPWRPRRLVVDLANVQEVGLGAALALTAEYHRSLLVAPSSFLNPCIDDAGWPVGVRELFDQLGFYDLVGASERTADPDEVGPTFPFRFVRFVGDELVDGRVANNLIEELKGVAGQAPARVRVYGALMEAIKNVRNHAYPEESRQRAGPTVARWWGAGAYLPASGELQFAVYDQGVGIPATLPTRPTWPLILKTLQPESKDADVIEAAIELGRTSTDLLERGNGLWTICSLVRELPGSSVTIWSGRGSLTFSSRGRVTKKNFGNPFCGTLIKWTLVLPRDSKPVTVGG